MVDKFLYLRSTLIFSDFVVVISSIHGLANWFE